MAKNLKELEKEIDESIEELELTGPPKNRKKIIMFIVWLVFAGIIIPLAIKFRWDKVVVGGAVFLVGLLSQGIAALLGTIGLVPVIGPVIVKFFAIPLVLLVNGLGNMLSFFAVKLGYKREVLDAKVLSITFMLGLLLGFMIAEMVK